MAGMRVGLVAHPQEPVAGRYEQPHAKGTDLSHHQHCRSHKSDHRGWMQKNHIRKRISEKKELYCQIFPQKGKRWGGGEISFPLYESIILYLLNKFKLLNKAHTSQFAIHGLKPHRKQPVHGRLM